MAKRNPADPEHRNQLGNLMKLYRESVKNVPLLRYSYILIATICILAIIGYFKLKNLDVFLYALGVIFISLVGYVASYLTKTTDRFFRMLLKILATAIVVTMCVAILGLGSYIVFKKPTFYQTLFPQKTNDTSQAKPAGPAITTATMVKDSGKKVDMTTDTTKHAGGKPAPPSLKIISVTNDMVSGLPCKYFTLASYGIPRLIITECIVKITRFVPYASIPQTQEVPTLAIWDIVLPYKTGTFHYKPARPIQIGDDAATIGVRLSSLYNDKKIDPDGSGVFQYTISFKTDLGITVTSEQFTGF
jgi:hypothetical protein